jgi:hypothetical protein
VFYLLYRKVMIVSEIIQNESLRDCNYTIMDM